VLDIRQRQVYAGTDEGRGHALPDFWSPLRNVTAPASIARTMIHSFGPFELDERRFELRRKGKPLKLPRGVLETITYLVKNPDRLISKDELLAGPWKGIAVSDAAISRNIMLARKALSDRTVVSSSGRSEARAFDSTVRSPPAAIWIT
jgi:DNA-binding response OmpR family regulator